VTKGPFNVQLIVFTLTQLFHHQNNPDLENILSQSTSRIEESGYDNWNGGTYFYTLYLEVPVELFASIESNLTKHEKAIESKLQLALRENLNHILNDVVIQPILAEISSLNKPISSSNKDLERIWGKNQILKLFISHQHLDKIFATQLKSLLAKYGIAAFVAHQDIEPTFEWQKEIKRALNTMDVFVALLSPNFRTSNWTDQEIGYAVARNVLMIHVRDGQDPYGFINETQSLSMDISNVDELAEKIVDIICKNPYFENKMKKKLLDVLKNPYGYRIVCSILRITSVPSLKGSKRCNA